MELASWKCLKCGCELSFDDVGIYRKLINRGVDRCMCMKCLSREINVTVEELRERAEYFKSIGCTLFRT